jgi:hypothetical protein
MMRLLDETEAVFVNLGAPSAEMTDLFVELQDARSVPLRMSRSRRLVRT